MKVHPSLTITKRQSDGAFYGEKNGVPYVIETSNADYHTYEGFYQILRDTDYSDRESTVGRMILNNEYPAIFGDATTSASMLNGDKTAKELLIEGIGKMMDFFSEFSFTPSFRFTNTFAFMACENDERAKAYVHSYFALMDSSYVKEIDEKMKSAEFTHIIRNIAQYGKPSATINTRLKVYYGSAGTGKTTIAHKEASGRCMVCNSSMLPCDLMEDFVFKDGKPDFKPSLLWESMEKGEPFVLDEINLLPFDSLRFLQGITDGKPEFYYKNRLVHIRDGFQIIGTMNLSLGGMVYGLPEPLVDRCADAREFVLTAEQLAKSIMGMDAE